MKLLTRLCAPACALLLAACATGPAPPGTPVAENALAFAVPGQTTRAQLVATLGATRTIAFDSGYEVWLYQSPAGGGRHAEFVVLLDPAGVVARTRRRLPSPSDPG